MIDYARNKYKLVGQYAKMSYEDFFSMNTDKKFDVIVGNPPYQANSNGAAEKLWPKFIDKAVNLCQENGYVAMITPTSWLAGSKNIVKGTTGVYDLFKAHDLQYVNLNISSFFNVGSTFGYFILRNALPNTETIFQTPAELHKISLQKYSFLPPKLSSITLGINNKTIIGNDSFSVKSFSGGFTNRSEGVDTADSGHTYKTYLRGNNTGTIHYAFFHTKQNAIVADSRKIIIPISGADKFMPFVDDIGIPHCMSSYVIPMKNTDTLESAISVFNSKLFRFLIEQNRSSGFIQIYVVKNLPKLDLSHEWTDQEIYDHFHLTQEEIDYIEQVTK
jgi:site-specific DNA-methyltransferase (adenine-specific)